MENNSSDNALLVGDYSSTPPLLIYDNADCESIYKRNPDSMTSFHKLSDRCRLFLQYNVQQKRIFIEYADDRAKTLFECPHMNNMPLEYIFGAASSPRSISKIISAFENREHSSFFVNLYSANQSPISCYVTVTPLENPDSGHNSTLSVIATINHASAVGNARHFALSKRANVNEEKYEV